MVWVKDYLLACTSHRLPIGCGCPLKLALCLECPDRVQKVPIPRPSPASTYFRHAHWKHAEKRDAAEALAPPPTTAHSVNAEEGLATLD